MNLSKAIRAAHRIKRTPFALLTKAGKAADRRARRSSVDRWMCSKGFTLQNGYWTRSAAGTSPESP